MPFHEAVQQTAIENLDFLAAGAEVSNPAELLATDRLGTLVRELRQAYDIVLVDTSPLLAVTDASVIAVVMDAVLLVVRAAVTHRIDAERSQYSSRPWRPRCSAWSSTRSTPVRAATDTDTATVTSTAMAPTGERAIRKRRRSGPRAALRPRHAPAEVPRIELNGTTVTPVLILEKQVGDLRPRLVLPGIES